MKAQVTEACIACGRCAAICPEVFEMGSEIAEVKTDPVPPEQEDAAQEAADECPTAAILITQ